MRKHCRARADRKQTHRHRSARDDGDHENEHCERDAGNSDRWTGGPAAQRQRRRRWRGHSWRRRVREIWFFCHSAAMTLPAIA
jgi:hypothetical protein